MILPLVVIGTFCALGLAVRYPRATCVLWILVLETSPDAWLDAMVGGHEIIIGWMKGFGLALVLILGLRQGWRADRYNPGFAFVAMFLVGLMHGLYPGLTLLASIRSLIGSAGPFLFSFVRLQPFYTRAVIAAMLWGPLFTVAFGGVLALTGFDHMFDTEQGALRLGASGEPPFLAGFALVGVYAGLMEYLASRRAAVGWLTLLNLTIILLTGARAPLVLASFVTLSFLIAQRRVAVLAATGAALSLGAMFLSALSFLRVVNMAELGETTNLSNRDLVWPVFAQAFAASPVTGWGVGAGKVIIPMSSELAGLIHTNAAHDEYLRIGAEGGVLGLALLMGLIFLWVKRGSALLPPAQCWLMRLIFLGFAIHSATDNTLIATTSSAFFLWVSVVFAEGRQRDTRNA